MPEKVHLIITSISPPNKILQTIAEGCKKHDLTFILIGDEASPSSFFIDGCHFYSIESQIQTGIKFASKCPKKHYARKNIGYLLSIQNRASLILETDDDNIPYEGFWRKRSRFHNAAFLENVGWVNVYSYFTDANIWPRGLPLDEIRNGIPDWDELPTQTTYCPIQQSLTNENPDVDAIYRLILPLPLSFRSDRKIALGISAWCPFNSQNTAWWPEVYPLLYLPSYCSFRMTDILRSFVAQKICWVNGWSILFHGPTAWQERNEHSLMSDFKDEIPVYIQNKSICAALDSLNLRVGEEYLGENLLVCYEKLVQMGAIGTGELPLVECWLEDIKSFG